MEKIDDVKNPAAKRRGFLSLALAAVGGFALTVLSRVSEVKAQDQQQRYLVLEQLNNGGITNRTDLFGNVSGTGVLRVDNLSEDGHGVEANTKRGVALFGHSDSWVAVQGNSISLVGVQGNSETGCGVGGSSRTGHGVEGNSETDVGVGGYSTSGVGVIAETETGVALRADGPVIVQCKLEGLPGVRVTSSGTGIEGVSKPVLGPVLGTGVEGRGRIGVQGFSDSPDGAGVEGRANATSGFALGVNGVTDSPEGVGVRANDSVSGRGMGVRGVSGSTEGTGVSGWAYAESGYTWGVRGGSESPNGIGVGGRSFGIGVLGAALAPSAVPMVAQGAAGQTANLQEWRNDAGIAVAVIDKDGNLLLKGKVKKLG